MIDRDQARNIAGTAVAPDKIGEVFSVEEVRSHRLLIYGFPREELADYWIAYVKFNALYGLRSSHVVLVKKSDGTIAYSGSANDEG